MKTDEDAIRTIELQFSEAWGRHDANSMVASLSDDAQFVTVNGAWTKTRADYLELMTRLHGPSGPFRTSTRETPIMHVRFLTPDVARCTRSFTYTAMLTSPRARALALVSYVRSRSVADRSSAEHRCTRRPEALMSPFDVRYWHKADIGLGAAHVCF